MKPTLISIKIDPDMKAKAQKTAQELGFSLSAIINAYLRQFVRTKAVHFDLESEARPSKYLLDSIRQSEKDIQNGDYYSFNNAEEAVTFLKDERKKSRRKKTDNN